MSPWRRWAIGLVVGDQDRIGGDGEAVDLAGNGDDATLVRRDARRSGPRRGSPAGTARRSADRRARGATCSSMASRSSAVKPRAARARWRRAASARACGAMSGSDCSSRCIEHAARHRLVPIGAAAGTGGADLHRLVVGARGRQRRQRRRLRGRVVIEPGRHAPRRLLRQGHPCATPPRRRSPRDSARPCPRRRRPAPRAIPAAGRSLPDPTSSPRAVCARLLRRRR